MAKPLRAPLNIVPSARHLEQATLRGQPAILLRKFISECADSLAPEQIAVGREVTRLAAARLLSKPIDQVSAWDNRLGALRRLEVSPAALLAIGSNEARQLAGLLADSDQWFARQGLRDARADSVLVRHGLERVWPQTCAAASELAISGITRFDTADLELFEALHRKHLADGGRGAVWHVPPARGLFQKPLSELYKGLQNRFDSSAPNVILKSQGTAPSAKVVLAANESAEARRIAYTVLAALERGILPDAIAIAPLEMEESFLEPLRAELDKARIPFAEPHGRPVLATPSGRTALDLFELCRGPLVRDRVVDIFLHAELNGQRWQGRSSSAAKRDFAGQLQKLPISVDRTRQDLLQALREQTGTEPQQAVAALSALLADLERLRETATRAAHKHKWLELYAALGLVGANTQLLKRALSFASDHKARAALFRTLADNHAAMSALETAMALSVDAAERLGLNAELVSPAVFIEEVLAAVSSVGRGRSAERVAAVCVGRPSELAGLPWQLAVLCRASAAHLDWSAESKGEKLELGQQLGQELGLSALVQADPNRAGQRFLELSGFLSLAKSVLVTAPLSHQGEAVDPSRFILEDWSKSEHEPASPDDPRAHCVVRPKLGDAEIQRRRAVALERESFFQNIQQEPSRYSGRALDLGFAVGGSPEQPIAITRIENYARCPFAAFAAVVLKATREQTVNEALGAQERGTLLHDVLAFAFHSSVGLWHSKDRAELEQLLLDQAREFIFSRPHTPLRRAVLEATLRDVAAIIRYSCQNSAEYGFFLAEQGFGGRDAESWPALEVGPWFVSGRIDRIDTNSDQRRLRIIDYKSGSRTATKREKQDVLLQPPLYLQVVKRQFQAEHVEAGYLPVLGRRPNYAPELELAESANVSQAFERAALAISNFRQGRVEPRPYDPRSCQHCEARDICRRPLIVADENGESGE